MFMEIKNKFIKNVVGSGEIDINKMPGFRSATDDEHMYISKKYQKAIGTNVITMLLWMIASAVFIVFHIYMYYQLREVIFLIFAAVFAVTIVINIYHILFVDKFTIDKIKRKDYQVAYATIHHMIPRIASQSGRPVAKIQDDEGRVYSQEFIVNKENKKIYQKNQEEKFLIIKIDEKKRVYGISHFSDAKV